MRRSVRLSFELGVCVLGIALAVTGCDGARRRGGPVPMLNDAGMVDGNVGDVDLGPAPDGDVPPPAGCGNGTVDVGEECDVIDSSETCDPDCTFAICGDRTINAARGEQCDDGNTLSEDGCDSACRTETPASCGDYTLDAGEACDAGPSGSSSCDSDCTFVSCGDFSTNAFAGEQCDSGGSSSSSCDRDCTLPACGDGLVNGSAGEVCDDADTTGADGCSAFCVVESSWTCSGEPSLCARMGGGTIDRMSTTVMSIPDASATGITSTLALTGATATSCTIDSITVDLSITHPYIGDLSVTLASPGGTSVVLHSNTGSSMDNILGTYPTTLTPYGALGDFAGEIAAGTWSLRVVDGSSADIGTLNSWAVHIVCL